MASGLIEEVLRLDASQAQGQLRAVAGEAKVADAALESVGTTTKVAGDKAAGASGALGQLAFQLNDVATMAALGANPLQILASQGGQIAQVVAQAGGATNLFRAALQAAIPFLTAWGPLLAGAAVAVGATAVALKAVSAEADQARADFEAAAAALETFRAAAEKAGTATENATAYIEDVTGATDEFEVALRRQRDSYIEGRASMESLLQARVTELEGITKGTAAYTEYDKQLKAARTQLSEWRAETEDTVSTMELAAAGLRRNKELTDAATEADKRAAEAKRRMTEAARAEAEAFRALQKEFAREIELNAKAREGAIAAADNMFSPVVDQAAVALGALDDALSRIASSSPAGRIREVEAAVADLTLAFSRGQISAEQFDRGMSAITTAQTQAGTVGADAIAGAISNPLSAIAAAHPIAGAVVAGLQAAARLPETLTSFSDLFAGAISNLGSRGASGIAGFASRFVSELLPGLVAAGGDFVVGMIEQIPRLLEAIAGSIGPLAVALIEHMTLLAPRIAIALVEVLLNPSTWIDAGRSLGEGFLQAIASLLEALRDLVEKIIPGRQFGGSMSERGLFTGGGFLDDAERTVFHPWKNAEGGRSKAAVAFSAIGAELGNLFSGVFDDGSGYVSQSGLAVVHAGEEIVQRGGRRSAAAMEGSTEGGRARLTGRGGRIVLELDPAELYRTLSHSGSALGLAGAFPLGG